jgi:hypothetical protein
MKLSEFFDSSKTSNGNNGAPPHIAPGVRTGGNGDNRLLVHPISRNELLDMHSSISNMPEYAGKKNVFATFKDQFGKDLPPSFDLGFVANGHIPGVQEKPGRDDFLLAYEGDHEYADKYYFSPAQWKWTRITHPIELDVFDKKTDPRSIPQEWKLPPLPGEESDE